MQKRENGAVSRSWCRVKARAGGMAGIDGYSVCTNYEYSDDIIIKMGGI